MDDIAVNYQLSPTYHVDTKRIEAYQLRCCGTRVWQENRSLFPRLLEGGTLVLGDRK